MSDERDKPSRRDRDVSWRDLDKKRDGSAHVDRGDPRRGPKSRTSNVTAVRRYKEDLSALFQRGEAGKVVKGLARQVGLEVGGGLPERQAALREVIDAVGPDAAARAVDRFLRDHGEFPDDPDVLCQALLHPDDPVRRDILQQLLGYLAGHIPPRKALLLQRVKDLEARSDDDEVRTLAGKARDLLGG